MPFKEGAPTSDTPSFIVLPSRDLVTQFRNQVKISERNLCELITQIFDRFMDVGIHEHVRLSPVLSMLISDPDLAANSEEALKKAFEELCHGLRACLCSLGLKGIMQVDHGEFNYAFHSLRANDIVVTYLSNEIRKI